MQCNDLKPMDDADNEDISEEYAAFGGEHQGSSVAINRCSSKHD